MLMAFDPLGAELNDQVRPLFDYELLLSPTRHGRCAESRTLDRLTGSRSSTRSYRHPGPQDRWPAGSTSTTDLFDLQIVAGGRRDDLALSAAARFEEAYICPQMPTACST